MVPLPRNQKSEYEIAGFDCSSCKYTTHVFGPNPVAPGNCPNCGAITTLKMLWHHHVSETIVATDLAIDPLAPLPSPPP